MDLKKYEIDSDKEINGVWVAVDDKTSLRIARMYNPKFNKLAERKRGRGNFAQLKDNSDQKFMNELLANTVLVDWKGLYLNDVEIPYTVDKALEFLNNPAMASFREDIVAYAVEAENYYKMERDDTIKKSPTTSSGLLSGANT